MVMYLLGYNAEYCGESPLAFWRNMPPFSRSKSVPSMKQAAVCVLFISWFPAVYTALYPRRYVGLVLIFLEDLIEIVSVCGATQLVVCLFPQYSVCHIHRECYGWSMPPVADLFLVWFSCVNSSKSVFSSENGPDGPGWLVHFLFIY